MHTYSTVLLYGVLVVRTVQYKYWKHARRQVLVRVSLFTQTTKQRRSTSKPAFREHRILFFVATVSSTINDNSIKVKSLLYNDVVYEKVCKEEEEKESLDYPRMFSRSCCLGSRKENDGKIHQEAEAVANTRSRTNRTELNGCKGRYPSH